MKVSVDVNGKSYLVRRYLLNEQWHVGYKEMRFSGRSPEAVTTLFQKWVTAGCPVGNFELQEKDINHPDIFMVKSK